MYNEYYLSIFLRFKITCSPLRSKEIAHCKLSQDRIEHFLNNYQVLNSLPVLFHLTITMSLWLIIIVLCWKCRILRSKRWGGFPRMAHLEHGLVGIWTQLSSSTAHGTLHCRKHREIPAKSHFQRSPKLATPSIWNPKLYNRSGFCCLGQ